MTDSKITWLVFLALAILLFWNFTRRNSGGTNVEVAISIQANVNDCLKTIDIRLADPLSKRKFQVANWKAFGKKTGFLSSELGGILNEAFTIAIDFNQKIDAARKNNRLSDLRDLPVENLRGPMLKAKEGLAAWMRTESKDELNNRRGCMGM